MIKVGIIGATGYAGAELVRLVSGHPDVELSIITSRQYAGIRFDKVYPAMSGAVDLVCENYSAKAVCDRADLIFMALPHKLPMEIVPDILEHGKKVIDLSADFRFNDPAKYEAHYQPHLSKELMDESVYGLCEVYFDRIKAARLIGNPGCYPTTVLLPLIPLLKENMIDTDSIIADSKSGVSGAGRSLSLGSHFCEANESFKAYKIAVHRHQPEMAEILSIEAGKSVSLTFVPHLIPLSRGMLTTIYSSINKNVSENDIKKCFSDYYSDRNFVRIYHDNTFPNVLYVRGTNYCDIGFKVDKQSNRLIIVSVIDNLVKGAAGQAVQNMNIMLGLDETRGLDNVPFPI